MRERGVYFRSSSGITKYFVSHNSGLLVWGIRGCLFVPLQTPCCTATYLVNVLINFAEIPIFLPSTVNIADIGSSKAV